MTISTRIVRSLAIRPLVVLVLAALGCSSKEEDYLGAGLESGLESGPEGVCYMEIKVGFWCDDGQVDAGVWEVECAAVERSECNNDQFASGVEYFSGCEWETKFENHAWMSQTQCEEKQEEGLLLANGEECAYHQDCESGCCGSPTAGYVCVPCDDVGGGPENTPAACVDDVDNDGDGYVDCDASYPDFECCGMGTCACSGACADKGACAAPSAESNEAACTDQQDNDGDGYIDCDASLPDYECCGVGSCACTGACAGNGNCS